MAHVKYKSSRPEVFLRKSVSKICRKLTGEHPCRSAIIALWHGCSPVNFLHIFRKPFPRNTSGWLLLEIHFYDVRRVLYSISTPVRTSTST